MAGLPKYPLLEAIDSPEQLRRLTEAELEPLAAEVRDFLIHTVSTRGGHFAALEEPELLVEDIRAFFRPLRFGAAND